MRDLRDIVAREERNVCGIAAAIAASAVVGAGASIYSSNKASGAAKGAADTNNALQGEIYNQNTANLTPFMQTGTGALGRLDASQQPGFDWNKLIANDPAAQFQMQQGVRAIDNSASARGLSLSGGTLKALDRYGQGVASDSINNWWNRNSQLAQFGLSGANALAGVGTNYANAVGANNNSAASAQANAALASSGQINNLLGQGVNAYSSYRGLNSIYGGGSGYAGPGVDAYGASTGIPADLTGLI